jgi:mannose-6-phosphate isomerase-like protein (cupin superfamily)
MSRASEQRPWGSFEILGEGAGWRTKRLMVLPGQRTSLQRHTGREEHWLVVEGQGQVILGRDSAESVALKRGTKVVIQVAQWHRIANSGQQPLVIVETWMGDDLREDDIERCDDDYGRSQAQ